MSFAKKLGSKVFDDILGIDPSGKGLVGSIKDNPKTAALLGSLLIPGVGSAITGGLGAAGSAIGGGLGSVGSVLGSGLGALGGLLGSAAPYAIGYGLGKKQGPQIPPEGFYNMPGMGGGLLGGGAPIGQSAFDYARSIAGGMPFEQVVQPGMEFSLEQPMGEPVAPQAPVTPQVPPAPVTPLFSGIDASIGGYRGPTPGVFDPFRDGVRVTEDWDRIGGGFRPTEIRGPGGDIFGGPLGPEDLAGKSDSALEQKNMLDLLVQGSRAPQFDPFRDGIRPTEIFGPGGEIIGPMGRMSDLTPQPQPVAPVVPEQLPLPIEVGPVDVGLVDPLMGNRFLDPFADPIRVPSQILPEPIYTQPGTALPIGPSKGLPSLLSLV